ncbi:MAG: glutathione S-transferase family protein [Thermoleophilia bacterium]
MTDPLLALAPTEPLGRGAFRRAPSQLLDAPAPGQPAGRYHLYVSLACPWAHRTLIVRRLKRLEDAIGVTVVDPVRDGRGWRFPEPEPVNGFSFLAEAYLATDPAYDGRFSVPVLWDTAAGRIVNNESAEIVVHLNERFDHLGDPGVDLYPAALRDEIDAVNAVVYANVNDGVYRTGFAGSQEAYEAAFGRLFAALDALELRLAGQRYLVGDRLTLADVRLYTTLVRFDAAYHGHFKCNLRRIVDYPALQGYLRDLYQRPGFGDTTDIDQIKRHYYLTHPQLDPSGIVPLGPELQLDAPHGRDALP